MVKKKNQNKTKQNLNPANFLSCRSCSLLLAGLDLNEGSLKLYLFSALN